MAKVADDIKRVVNNITSDRRQSSDMANAIKSATRARRREVRSMLSSMRASRIEATAAQAQAAERGARARRRETILLLKEFKSTRQKIGKEQNAEAQQMMRDRAFAVHSLLRGLASLRRRAARDYRAGALVTLTQRRNEVASFLRRRRQGRKTLVIMQREIATAFMRNLTDGVGALLDGFDKDGRDRAAAIRKRLAPYAPKRRDVPVVSRNLPGPGRQPAPPSVSIAEPLQEQHVEPPTIIPPVSAPQEALRHPKRSSGGLNQKAPGERHMEASK